jgi:holliday junction DNA helicase RuvA
LIARLRGKPAGSTPDGLVLDVGGVGYLVAATPSAIRKADGAEEVVVETYLHVREELRRAIVREDTARFQAIPGIGKKTAERIVLELKEKIGAGVTELTTTPSGDTHVVARDALVELGYTLVEAERALAESDPSLPPEDRVRLALKRAA